MEYINDSERVQLSEDKLNEPKILCCECGILIKPNLSNMCVNCLRTHIDITEDIPKQAVLYFCRNCERYLLPPSEWIYCTLESKELLSICMKKLHGLKDVHVEDASFVWTEPHSKRMKVKLTVRKEIFGGALLEQVFVVEYTVNNQMCTDCHRTEAKDYWRTSVQVRQHTENRKTFYYLEQLILKHKIHENALGIKPVHGGLDFFYANETQARKLVNFLNSKLPIKSTESRRLISHDVHSNTYNDKHTISIEIVPLSKDSLLCLDKKLAQSLGNIAQICLIARVANTVHLIDPKTAQVADLSATVYYRQPFGAICNPKQLIEFIVMDIELIDGSIKKSFPGQGKMSERHAVADIWVVKASELGVNENTIHTRTHLGHLLKPGDSVLGYNLIDANINDVNFDKLNVDKIADVVLVKKLYTDDNGQRRTKRNWKLKHLSNDLTELDKGNRDYEEFLDDLEEDQQFRKNINLFKDPTQTQTLSTDDKNDMTDLLESGIAEDELLDDNQVHDDENDNENNNVVS